MEKVVDRAMYLKKKAKVANIGPKLFLLNFKSLMPCFHSERCFCPNIRTENEMLELKGHVSSLPWQQVCLCITFGVGKGAKYRNLL
jgi:hypothetical protein